MTSTSRLIRAETAVAGAAIVSVDASQARSPFAHGCVGYTVEAGTVVPLADQFDSGFCPGGIGQACVVHFIMGKGTSDFSFVASNGAVYASKAITCNQSVCHDFAKATPVGLIWIVSWEGYGPDLYVTSVGWT